MEDLKQISGCTSITIRMNKMCIRDRESGATGRSVTAMTSRLAAVRLNKVIAKAMAGMLPPDDLTVTEWEMCIRDSSRCDRAPLP